MSITVKFFARLREQVGQAETSLNDVSDVQSAWNQATQNMSMPDNTLCAINMQYVSSDAPVKDGDEVAFFPPVTGGCYAQ
ncbi:MAG: MoaD/ThiS family protein [Gammaproteobacteria bacterium]|nr:MoaD/ThiS family protein [Gammaproteobacteria bacterium]